MKVWIHDWRVQVGSLDLGELDVTFKIKRTLAARAGTCELTVFNLTAEHRHAMQQAQHPFVRVEAGYREGRSVIFQGDARKVQIGREKTDWKATITAGDGEHAVRTARVSRSFGAGTEVSTVVAALADAMGVGRGNVATALAGASLGTAGSVFTEGTVLHGRAAGELTRLAASLGMEWSVQEGVLQLLARGAALERTAVVLTSDTGLIDVPEVGKRGIVKAKALLLPDLVPGRLVRLDTSAVSGTYRIESGVWSGDTRSNDWYVEMVLRVRS